MKKVLVLGCGLVGAVIARRFTETDGIQTTVADFNEKNLKKLPDGCSTIVADLSNPEKITGLAEDFDLVLGALPGNMGMASIEAVIKAGKPCVDISFLPENPSRLNDAAKSQGIPVVYDFGVAPGMSHLLSAYGAGKLDKAESLKIYVGGLPTARKLPYEYAAVFSPIDVIEEYTRPARIVENGQTTIKPALSGLELIDFPGIGTLEAFYTDGLRSLAENLGIPDMVEKTMRYPGHAERMKMLRETGFFSYDPININGAKIRPIDLTSRLLFPMWKLEEKEREFTVMRVEVGGQKDGGAQKYVYDLVDYTDEKRGETSMARTTGLPAYTMAKIILEGVFDRPGVHPPEKIGADGSLAKRILAELRDYEVTIRETSA